MKCPKCSYVRKMGETAPDWQCPSCGVAYAKANSVGVGETRVEQQPDSGGGKFGKVLFVILAVAIVWALAHNTRQQSAPARQGEFAGTGIVMYSLTTCGFCNAKRAELRARGIPFVEYFVDTDRDRQRELFEKLLVSGYQGGGIGTPTFEVNGTMLPNNPSLETIIKHM